MKFDFDNPYPSTRIPVFARNVVSTSHPLAAQAGLRMLLAGRQRGRRGDRRRRRDDDRRAGQQRPGQRRLLHPVGRQGAARPECLGPRAGGLDAGVLPQQVRRRRAHAAASAASTRSPCRARSAAGWRCRERFGKLPFADLLEPAIEIAERGYLVPPVVQQKWAAATPSCSRSRASPQGFLPWGRAPQVGELFRFPAAARALRRSPRRKGEAFYRGEIAAGAGAVLRRQRRQPHGAATSPPTSPSGSSRSRATTAATRCTRSRPTARASRR